jgi:anaerobic selenocysteine-containing dehydrogenase
MSAGGLLDSLSAPHREVLILTKVIGFSIAETAEKLGIKDGDWMWIENSRGKIRQKVKLWTGIDPRVIHCEHGWWFPDQPGPDYGVWDSNVNVLTSNLPPFDPQMGTYHLRALLCRVERADPPAR